MDAVDFAGMKKSAARSCSNAQLRMRDSICRVQAKPPKIWQFSLGCMLALRRVSSRIW